MKVIIFVFIIFFVTGCSHTLHERKEDESNSSDQGSKTELQLRGPRAAVKHSF